MNRFIKYSLITAAVLLISIIAISLFDKLLACHLPIARTAETTIAIKETMTAAQSFEYDCKRMPKSGNELLHPPSECKAEGPYLKGLPKDSWDQDLIFLSTEDSFSIISYGADKKEGGVGPDADLIETVPKRN